MNITYDECLRIKVKTMNTLQVLMGALLLQPEYDIIVQGQKQKL